MPVPSRRHCGQDYPRYSQFPLRPISEEPGPLREIADHFLARMIDDAKGVNRVSCDIRGEPPATIGRE